MSLKMYQILSSHNCYWRFKPYAATPWLTTIQSYDQTFLKKTSIQATIKIFFLLCIWQISGSPFYISLKKCCSYYFATENLLPWIPTWPAGECVFHPISFYPMNDKFDLWPGIQEGVLFVGWVVLVVGVLCWMWRGTNNTLSTSKLVAVEWTVPSPGCYTPGETSPVPIKYTVVCALEPAWMLSRRKRYIWVITGQRRLHNLNYLKGLNQCLNGQGNVACMKTWRQRENVHDFPFVYWLSINSS